MSAARMVAGRLRSTPELVEAALSGSDVGTLRVREPDRRRRERSFELLRGGWPAAEVVVRDVLDDEAELADVEIWAEDAGFRDEIRAELLPIG